jgi:hypothetical protein
MSNFKLSQLLSFHTNKRYLLALSISTLVIATVVIRVLPTETPEQDQSNSEQFQNAVGICRGFGTEPIATIPVAVIKAASTYLKTDMAVGVLSYATQVDPVRESSVPHRCLGVRDDLDPNSLDQKLTDKMAIEALAAKQQNYSGVIPAGATKALRISVLHPAWRPNYDGNEPVIIEFLNSSSAYASSDLIVAYFPKQGWKGVFKFPDQGGYPAYP